MKFSFEIENLRDLVHSAGLTVEDIGQRLGRSESNTRDKLTGRRALYLDEVGAIAAAITEGGRVKVTKAQLLKLLGSGRVQVRGFVD